MPEAKKEVALNVAEPRNISLFKRGNYKGIDIKRIATRPGSMDILSNPSRVANTLFHLDGTTTKVNDNE
jgi:hypothetical protein